MKKAIFVSLLCLPIMAIIATSCSQYDDDPNSLQDQLDKVPNPDAVAYTTTHIDEENLSDYAPFYFTLDNNDKLQVLPNIVSKKFKAVEGERSVLYFAIEEEEQNSYDIKMCKTIPVIVGDCITVNNKEENDKLKANRLAYINANISFVDNWLNLFIGYGCSIPKNASFSLIENTYSIPESIDNQYLNLELRYSNNNTPEDYDNLNEEYLSFNLAQFATQLKGKWGINLKINTINSGTIHVKVNNTTSKTTNTSLYPAESSEQL